MLCLIKTRVQQVFSWKLAQTALFGEENVHQLTKTWDTWHMSIKTSTRLLESATAARVSGVQRVRGSSTT